MVKHRTLEGLGALVGTASAADVPPLTPWMATRLVAIRPVGETRQERVCAADFSSRRVAVAVARLLRAAGVPAELVGGSSISLMIPPEFSDLAKKILAKRRRDVEDEEETDDEEEEEEDELDDLDEEEDEDDEDFEEDDEEFEEEFEDDELDDDDDIFYDDDDDE